MLTGKERAQYRKEANGLETIMQIGKGGLEETSVRQIDEALTARELIKIRVLETCSESVREVATSAAEATTLRTKKKRWLSSENTTLAPLTLA